MSTLSADGTAPIDVLGAVPSEPLRDARQRALRDIRISLTDHCNLRCSYCMPKDAVGSAFVARQHLLDFDEIARLVRILAELGVRKVKLTGGEPLTRPFLPRLIQLLRASAPAVEINLITNGILLAPLARELREAGLDRVTVSLDTLNPARFSAIAGRGRQLDKVLGGIAAAGDAGFRPIKVNAVVVRGMNDDEVEAMANHFRHTGIVLRFIEYMDVGTVNNWRLSDVVTAAEILMRLQRIAPLVPVSPGYTGETAKRYRFADGSGEVGFIASVSQPFCGDCSRLRLSADGRLFTCLFSKDGLDIKTILRNAGDAAARATIAALWQERKDQYSVERALKPAREKIEMFYIGG